jgi:hypothetical protein
VERLLEELVRLGDPDQDNISFTVIKVNDASVRPQQDRVARNELAVTSRPRKLTTVVAEPVLLPLPAAEPLILSAPEPVEVDVEPAAPSVPEDDIDADTARTPVVPRRFAALG